jgi:membrane protease YdiL (CAAX protease family)
MMAVNPWRASWLLACLRLKRLSNLLINVKFRAKPGQSSRPATPAKRRMSALFAVLIVATMMFSFGNIARQSVLNLQCELSPAAQCHPLEAARGKGADADVAERQLAAQGISPPLAAALSLQLSLLLVVSFLVPLGSREIANTDGDLEWLVTLPVKRTTLLAARIVERSVANPTGMLAMLPSCLMVAWFSGYRWSAPLIALAGALVLLPIAAVLRTVADTGLRMTLSPSQLRNLQAVCGVASLPFMYLAMSFGMPSAGAFTASVARSAPGWIMWTPPGLVIEAIRARTAGGAIISIGLLLAELALCAALGMLVLNRQLRDGVVASGVRESGRRAAPPVRSSTTGTTFWHRLLPRSAVQRRELRLLSRDRNFLVQSLLMPVVMVVSQMLINGKLNALGELAASPVALGLTAWGISAYMLMLSALQTLNNEGQVLWMLYTFPKPLERVLKEKAQLWSALAMIYPVAVLALGLALAPAFNWRTLSTFVIVLAGIPVYSAIAVALGVFACDPLAQDARTRVRPSYVYLYMLLASMYGYAVYAEQWMQTVVVMVLTACLAQALWQKARDSLPYLLDPAAAPPSRVSTADGMMAVMLFFVLQVVAYLFLTKGFELGKGPAVVLAFLTAGAVVYALTRFVYWRNKTLGVPVLFAGHSARSIAWGLGLGFAAACVGLAYLYLLGKTSWWSDLVRSGMGARLENHWVFLLAVLLAPLCEEFIFRGLLFGGLRRSAGFVPAMLMSAALFAIVHPPVSMLPVFGLGLCTAFAYERSKGLLAPMLVHAVYNAAVLGYQMSL